MIRFCSAAVPSEQILNWAETSVSSPSAFSTPLRAIVQKSAELLVTNASFNSFAAGLLGLHAGRRVMHSNRTHAQDFFIDSVSLNSNPQLHGTELGRSG